MADPSPIPAQESFDTTESEDVMPALTHNMQLRKNLEVEFKQASASAQHALNESVAFSINSATMTNGTTTTNLNSTTAHANSHANTSQVKTFSVHLRLRPSETSTLEIINKSTVRAHPPRQGTTKDYTFTNVLEPSTSQFDVYQQTAAPLVHSLFAPDHGQQSVNSSTDNKEAVIQLGSSALLFCYGMTNAGKTYTVTGDLDHDCKWGVLPRAIQDVFCRAQKANLQVHLGYIEIYNEQVYDLLQPQDKFTKTCPVLKIRDNHNGMAVCKGLIQVPVESVQHGLALVNAAKAKRQTGSNNLNAGSSRSHCICQLSVSSGGSASDGQQQQQVSMWIVDLAGSERAKRTDAGQARLKEASQINMSLMTLMRCLMALREDPNSSSNKQKERPPYRDSKLTHLLMNHLTGPNAGRTTMIVNVHPAECDFDETQHVLLYAAQAKHVVVQTSASNGDKKKAAVLYGENGRKIVPQQGKVAKLLAKLSPTRMLARKRKVEGADKDALHKKMKPSAKAAAATVPPTGVVTAAAGKVADAASSKELRRLKMQVSVLQTENQSLKRNNEGLIEENESLKDQLEALEENVRAEVVDEMEAKQTEMNEKYESIINGLKLSLRENSHAASTTKSTRKKQLDRADKEIEELLDRVEEGEEEMKRMRIEYETETQTIQLSHQNQVDKLQAEIKVLTEAKVKLLLRISSKDQTAGDASESADGDVENMDEASLRMELSAARQKIAKLQRSKDEMEANYEKLIAEGDESDGQDELDVEDEDQDNDTVIDVDDSGLDIGDSDADVEKDCDLVEPESSSRDSSLSESKAMDDKSSFLCVQGDDNENDAASEDGEREDENDCKSEPEIMKSSGKFVFAAVSSNRAPLESIADNTQASDDSDEFGPDQWLFPKKQPKVDESSGNFMRPKGRKPKGAEDWDGRKGAWRLSIM